MIPSLLAFEQRTSRITQRAPLVEATAHARQAQAAMVVLSTPAARDPQRLARYAPFLTHPAVTR